MGAVPVCLGAVPLRGLLYGSGGCLCGWEAVCGAGGCLCGDGCMSLVRLSMASRFCVWTGR